LSARPITGLPLRAGIIAVMPTSEVSSSFGVISFDFHVRVAKPYKNDITLFILSIYTELFRTALCSERFVKSYFAALILSGGNINIAPIFVGYFCSTATATAVFGCLFLFLVISVDL
jgi:hypothetical protein